MVGVCWINTHFVMACDVFSVDFFFKGRRVSRWEGQYIQPRVANCKWQSFVCKCFKQFVYNVCMLLVCCVVCTSILLIHPSYFFLPQDVEISISRKLPSSISSYLHVFPQTPKSRISTRLYDEYYPKLIHSHHGSAQPNTTDIVQASTEPA
jgi:hypothetical protein